MSNSKAVELIGLSEKELKEMHSSTTEWNFINEDYSPLAIENYPVHQIIRTKRSIKNVIVGRKSLDTNEIV